jgi:cell division transport system ATP-binding protein
MVGDGLHSGQGIMAMTVAGEHEDVHGDQAGEPDNYHPRHPHRASLTGIGRLRILVATSCRSRQDATAPRPARPPLDRERSAIVIKLDHVSKSYGNDVLALDDVSVEVSKGEFVFVVGQSGSGKSTFLRLLTKEERPTAGKIWVAGKELNRLASWKVPALRRSIGCVFQDFKLLSNKTVRENVAFALEVIGARRHSIERTVPEVLKLVGLQDKTDRFPHELSGGEQQRVSIARAFVNRPLLMLCDEPTGNLDPTTSQDIMRLLERINRTGTTVVMATHDERIVDQMRKRVVELEHGKVVRDQERGVYDLGV